MPCRGAAEASSSEAPLHLRKRMTWRAGTSSRDAVDRDFSEELSSDAPVSSPFCFRRAFREEAITCVVLQLHAGPDNWSANLDSTGMWWLSQPPPFVSLTDLTDCPAAQSLPLSAVVKNSTPPSAPFHPGVVLRLSFDQSAVPSHEPRQTFAPPGGRKVTDLQRLPTGLLQNRCLYSSAHPRAASQ